MKTIITLPITFGKVSYRVVHMIDFLIVITQVPIILSWEDHYWRQLKRQSPCITSL